MPLTGGVSKEIVADARMEHSGAVKSNKVDAYNNVNRSYKHTIG